MPFASPNTRRRRRDLVRGLMRPGAEGRPQGPGRDELLVASRPAMGSYFEVRLPAGVPGALGLATAALDEVDRLEAQLTVYRDDSEVARLNAQAHPGPFAVEPGLFGLLERSIALHRETEGAFDVAAGALSIAWGFVRGPRRVPTPGELADARARSGSRLVQLDPEARAVTFDRPGVAINLGSIGKGYAIDRAAAIVRDYWWPTSALIHGGRSSLYALGSPPWSFGGRWEVGLFNPFDPSRPLGTIRLRNRGLATSGACYQSFEANGRRYGHIIDPRTGTPPSDGPASVTVLAPTAAEADALSTAFYLLGPVAATEILASRPGTSALFVQDGPADAPPRITILGLGLDEFDPDPSARVARWS